MTRVLVLVPTDLELGLVAPGLRAPGRGSATADSLRIARCGFGPVIAAARTGFLLAEHRPARVLLVGIAGRFAGRLEVGTAFRFDRVACHGVGVGSGAAFRPAASLGWEQWSGADGAASSSRIGDELPCATGNGTDLPRAGLLLSACAASAGPADVADRMRLHPHATAEDMEGFAVAAACRLAGVPLDIVRGISNTAGDRDTSTWRIEDACRAAAVLARAILEAPS